MPAHNTSKVFLDYRKPALSEKKRCHLCLSFVPQAAITGRGGLKGYEPRCERIGFDEGKEQQINVNYCCRKFERRI